MPPHRRAAPVTYARLDLGPIRSAMETAGAAMMAVGRPNNPQLNPPDNKDVSHELLE